MALFADPFDGLSSLQQTMDAFRASGWLNSGPSGDGAYPPVNVFRKGDDFIIITEVPGIKKSDLEVQVKGTTVRLGKDLPRRAPNPGRTAPNPDRGAASRSAPPSTQAT